jgi:hypothetical protein
MIYTGWTDLALYPGRATGKRYQFGLFRQRGYVDRRDVPGLLEILEDGQQVFREEPK